MKGEERNKILEGFHRGLYRTEDLMIKASGVMIFLLAILGSASVIGRYLFKMPVPDMPTLGEQIMVFIIFLALARTQRCKAHVRVDALVSRLPGSFRKPMDFVGLALGVLVFSVLAWQSFKLALYSWEVGDSASVFPYYPLWPGRFLVPIGSFVMVCQLVIDIFAPNGNASNAHEGVNASD